MTSPSLIVQLVLGALIFLSSPAWSQLVPVGQRVIWEKDLEQATVPKTGCHLNFVLKNTSAAEVKIEDFSIDGVASEQLPAVKVISIVDGRWWAAWPNPVAAGEMTSLKIRLADGPATLADENATHSLVLKTSAGEVTIPFQATPSSLAISFVYFSEDLSKATVYVGNSGSAAVPFKADSFLKINGQAINATSPATEIEPGGVVPLSVSLPAVVPGSLVVVQAEAGGKSAAASLRALPNTFGATYWFQVRDFDPVDLAAHHIRTDIPGFAAFADEPGHRGPSIDLAQKLTKAFDAAPAIPRMLQLTSSQELQVFSDMPDIVMTHSNKNQVVNPQAEVAVPLTAPRPFWYLPQNAWGRAESVTRHYREFFGTLADLDREAYQGLSYGAKNIQWFSMMTLWWQDKKREGGTDLARTEAPIYFPGALSNPALWDRTGRMNGVMAALSGYLADSTPAFRGKTADEIVVSTLVTPTAENAVIVAIDGATNHSAFYKSNGRTKEKLKEFTNLKLEARIPSYLKAKSAYLVDPYEGVQPIPFARTGNTFQTTIPKFRVGTIIVLGTEADASKLAAAWKEHSAPFANFADAPGNGAVAPGPVTYPKWKASWPIDELTRDLDASPDGSAVLVARGPRLLCFDAAGKILWTKDFPGEVLKVRFGAKGRIYVAANLNPDESWNWTNTNILALNPDGSEIWKHPVGGTPAGGTVFDLQTNYADGVVAYGTWSLLEKLSAAGEPSWSVPANFRAKDISTDKSGNTYFSDQGLHHIVNSSGIEVRKWREPAATPWEPNLCLAASPDGARIARGGYRFYLYDGDGNKLADDYIGRTVRAVAFSADGSAVAAGTADGVLSIYDAMGAKLFTDRVPGAIVSGIIPIGPSSFAVMHELFSYDVSEGWRYRDSTDILDKTGKRTARFEGPWRASPWMGNLVASADGKTLTTLDHDGVRSYNTADAPRPNDGIFNGGFDAPLPDGWKVQDIGDPQIAGSARFFPFDDSWVINASGTAWHKMPSAGTFAGTQIGDAGFTLTAHVRSVLGAGPYGSAGILVAESLDPAAPLAAFFLQPRQKTDRVNYRVQAGANYQAIQGKGGEIFEWLRVERDGDSLQFSISKNGKDWEPQGDKIQVPIGSGAYAGLLAVADSEFGIIEAVFDHVTLEKK